MREGHGCVFGFIDLDHGSRLTDLADRSGLTKQAVGEAVAELERKGYVERVPDPLDGRAKIIKLTRARRARPASPAAACSPRSSASGPSATARSGSRSLRECAEEIAAGYRPAEALGSADRARVSV